MLAVNFNENLPPTFGQTMKKSLEEVSETQGIIAHKKMYML